MKTHLLAAVLAMPGCSAPQPLDIFEPFDCESQRECPGGYTVVQSYHNDMPPRPDVCRFVRLTDPELCYLSAEPAGVSCAECPSPDERALDCHALDDSPHVYVWGNPGRLADDCVDRFTRTRSEDGSCPVSCDDLGP